MTIAMTGKLRNSLRLDAVVSGAFGLVALAAGGLLGKLTGLSPALVTWAGVVAAAWSVALLVAASRPALPRLVLFDIVLANAAWVAASLFVVTFSPESPTALGYIFVVAQAGVVALLAVLQSAGLRLPGRIRA